MRNSLSNVDARRLFLFLHGLANPLRDKKTKNDLPDVIKRIGFVQVDSIKTVERAHHHILFSRLSSYKPEWLEFHLEKERNLFENWTHDASIIPIEFYPYWNHRFLRTRAKLIGSRWWNTRMGKNPEITCGRILDHIAKNGPVKTRDLQSQYTSAASQETQKKTAWWGWNPAKAALVFLWRTGSLAVAGREGFQKIYDLTERIVPEKYRTAEATEEEFINWNCLTALEKIGFGSSTEIAKYLEGVTPLEAKTWCAGSQNNYLMEIQVQGFNGEETSSWAHPDIFSWLELACEAPRVIRFLSPFDPLIRDRKRTSRLFGFDFKIEIYVPESKRVHGYYVCPILEGDGLIGRIEMKVNRNIDSLLVCGFWLEPGIKLTKKRHSMIEIELHRWRCFLALQDIKSLVSELAV